MTYYSAGLLRLTNTLMLTVKLVIAFTSKVFHQKCSINIKRIKLCASPTSMVYLKFWQQLQVANFFDDESLYNF